MSVDPIHAHDLTVISELLILVFEVNMILGRTGPDRKPAIGIDPLLDFSSSGSDS